MRNTVVAALVVAIALVSPALAAEKQGFSIGGSIGSSRLEIDEIDTEYRDVRFKEDDLGYKLFVGYRFLEFLGVEAGYVDFGNPSYSTNLGEFRLNTDVALSGWDLIAVGYLPVGMADIFFKVGYFWWDGEFNARLESEAFREATDGGDLMWGMGVAFWIRQVSIRAEFEMFDVERADRVWLTSVGVTYTF